DNTLVSKGLTKLTNADNDFDVELPKNLNDKSEISVSKDSFEISFKIIEDLENSKAVVDEIVENKKRKFNR
nr:hypothetical protein [Treponema sp.]